MVYFTNCTVIIFWFENKKVTIVIVGNRGIFCEHCKFVTGVKARNYALSVELTRAKCKIFNFQHLHQTDARPNPEQSATKINEMSAVSDEKKFDLQTWLF